MKKESSKKIYLRYNYKYLDYNIIKNIFHPSKSVIIKNKNEEKRKINYQSRFSLPSNETRNNNEKINKSKKFRNFKFR